MWRLTWPVLWLPLAAASMSAQQTSSSLPHEHVRVYASGPGITAPQLLPLELPALTVEKCKDKIDGMVRLSLLIDASGQARNIMFVQPVGNDADVWALRIAREDRFKPGIIDGNAVVTAASLKVQIKACQIINKDPAGNIRYGVRLRSLPVQELGLPIDPPSDAVFAPDSSSVNFSELEAALKVGLAEDVTRAPQSRTSKPLILFQPIATYTESARKAGIRGVCVVSAIVDAHGLPQHLSIATSLDEGLDRNALLAVSQYRFKPAIRDGEPVPVMVKIALNFSAL